MKEEKLKYVASCIKQYYPMYWNKIDSFPKDKCACILKVKEKWGVLGNFGPARIVVDGVEFVNSEQLFQMMKFKDAELLKELHASRGMTIKMKARSKRARALQRPDWGSMLVDAMKFCLVQKFEQCADFRKELECTKSEGLFIVEDETSRKRGKNADTWGTVLVDGNYVGPNLLGKLLMELRDKGTLTYHLPDDAFEFIELLK